MLRSLVLIAVPAVLLSGLMVCVVASAPSAAAKDPPMLRDFMRKKLDASSKILEGLTTEDDSLIRDGANKLLEMSKAEMWNVLVDEDYREFNREFRSSVHKLHDAAEKGNYNNATLQWFDTVKACVECHKYVRSQRPVTKN